ncbi:MAG: CAP domain-containing protein [Paracoccaceae bacterium]
MLKCLALALVALSVVNTAQACTAPPDLPRIQADLIRDINIERRAKGLSALTASPALTKAAQRLACDNAARRVVGHIGKNGSTLKSRLIASGYNFSTAAENAAGGYGDPASVTAGWMHSPEHRRNILTAPLRDIGVGVAKGQDGLLYWIIDLGAAR